MSNYNQEKTDHFKCTIISSCAKLGESKENGNCKELNYISYGGADPKWDIREWNSDHTKMSRGITLNDTELLDLYSAIGELLKHDKPSISGPSRPKAVENPWTQEKDQSAPQNVTEDGEIIEDDTEEDDAVEALAG